MLKLPDEIIEINQNLKTEGAVDRLYENLRGCIPFVGAGLSVEFGLPLWKDFIVGSAEKTGDAELIKTIGRYIGDNGGKDDYEAAASVLYEFSNENNRNGFTEYGRSIFNSKVKDSNTEREIELKELVKDSTVNILPRIFDNLVITTNYDDVLQTVYGNYYSNYEVVGPRYPKTIRNDIRNCVSHTVQAIIKLHGDFKSHEDYIFTKEQYEKKYGDGDFQDAVKYLLTNRTLLFLGCSLVNERFLNVWGNILKDNEKFTQYAVMSKQNNDKEQKKLEKFLKDYNISTLWYPAGEHKYLKIILEFLAGKIIDNVKDNKNFVNWTKEYETEKIISNIYPNGSSLTEKIRKGILNEFKNNFTYITGLAGIGKTTLLNSIYHMFNNVLDTELPYNIIIRYVVYMDNWENTLLGNNISLKDDKKYVLFIDNIPNNWQTSDISPKIKEFLLRNQIFVTSRRIINGDIKGFSKSFVPIDLGMRFPRPFELFDKYFTAGTLDFIKNDASINEIIKLSGSHTLTLELLARHANFRCSGLYIGDAETKSRLKEFAEDLNESGFNLSDLINIGTYSDGERWEDNIVNHLALLVTKDDLNSSQNHLMKIFSLLANDEFHPAHIKYNYPEDSMYSLLQLGWIKKLDEDSFTMHEIIKKLVHDKNNQSEIKYMEIRELVMCIGKSLNKRKIEIENKGNVYLEIANINHAQSIYDYISKWSMPENENIDILNIGNPIFDDAFLELMNNLFSSYDDIELREKALEGSIKSEKMRQNYLDYSKYNYALSANSIGYLCCHADKNIQGIEYLHAAKDILDSISNQNDKEIMILRGKLLSNYGAYYQGCMRKLKKSENYDAERDEYYKLALDYHNQSLELRKKLYDEYPEDNTILNYLFVVQGSIAGDHFYGGNLVQSLKKRLELLPEQEKFYDKNSDKLFLAYKLIGDTSKNIASSLKDGKTVEGADANEKLDYINLSIKHLSNAVTVREKLDNDKQIIKELEESIKLLESWK
jgi:hypothetical protein